MKVIDGVMFVAALTAGCGGRVEDDLDAATGDSGPRQTCNYYGGSISDAAPGTGNTLTCPVDWHCDAYGVQAPEAVCCPPGPGHSGGIGCTFCECRYTCCPAGFSCADVWKAAVFADASLKICDVVVDASGD